MQESTESTAAADSKRGYIIEIVTAVVLGLATVGAAFAAYQASLCDGNTLDRYNEGIAKITESSAKQLEAAQSYTFDMITWMEWQSRKISADKQDGPQAKIDGEIAQEIEDDFMEERLKQALIWSDNETVKQKKYVHPTESPDYAMDLFADTFALQDESKKAIEQAKRANDLGDQFTLTTVLFTIVMFFSGIATVFKRDAVKMTMLVLATLLLVATAAKLFMLPMAG